MVKKALSKRTNVAKTAKAQSISKKTHGKTKSTEVVYHSTKEIKVDRALIDNFIGLQKVMVNLSVKFDSLSGQISKLLDLFEISARALAKKELSSTGNPDARNIMEKLDNISKQAGLIGKGLALIHEVGTENQMPVIPYNQNPKPATAPVSQPSSQPAQSVPAQKPAQIQAIGGIAKPSVPLTKPINQGMGKGLSGFQRSIDTSSEKTGEGAIPSS